MTSLVDSELEILVDGEHESHYYCLTGLLWPDIPCGFWLFP